MYRIERYLTSEDMYPEDNVLEVSESRIDISVCADEVVDGEIRVRSREQQELHVFFYSNHYRMQCRISDFIGKEGVFTYRFDASGLDVGSVVKGEICVLSETGEYRIPFRVSVRQPLAETSMGEVRNLFHFANLAKENWEEAVDLFYSEYFCLLFYGHDHRYYDLYRALSKHAGNEHNVDEFLVAIHKKQKNIYSVAEEGLLLKDISGMQQESVTLVRGGWGYDCVKVRTGAEFLIPQKTVLTRKDFENNECKVLFDINENLLFGECNTGSIFFDYDGGSLEVPVIINRPSEVSRKQLQRQEEKMLFVQLMHHYIACETQPKQRVSHLKDAEKALEKINAGYGRNLWARLFQMHVMLEQERAGEAKWVLSHVEKTHKQSDMDPAQYGYYLYLRSLLEADEKFQRSVVEQLEKLLDANQTNVFIACLYMKMIRQNVSPEKQLLFYENQYLAGSRSPMLYLEVFRVYAQSPAYLAKLDAFEISVLRFGIRYGIYTPQLAERVADLVLRKKEMTPMLYRFLGESYGIYPEDSLLQAFCTLMVRSGMCGRECFGWYELAVHKQMRITSLYEYYMLSADTREDRLPPRAVLMYFAYQCDLDEKRKAYLYALLVRHREEIPELFRQYRENIKQFAVAEMEKGLVTENLALLYRYFLAEEGDVLPKDKLQNIAFRHLIKVQREDIVSVIVVQDKMKKENVYPVEKNRAYVDCYTSEYVVVLEDEAGNRYSDEADWTDIKLMSAERPAVYLEEHDSADIGYSLYQASIGGNPEQVSPALWPLYEKLASHPDMEDSYRSELGNRLLRLYFDHEKYDEMKTILQNFNPEHATSAERAEAVRYLVYLEQDQQAYDILYNYGFENVSAKVLARLIGRTMENDPLFDGKLMAIIYYTFCLGKYTQDMLVYLCRYFEGSLKQMREVWKAAASFDVDASGIAERILQAYLFSHAYLAGIADVFDYYVSHRKRDSVVKGYINAMTYRYFVKQQPASPEIFGALEGLLCSGCEMDDVSKVAYLHYMSSETDSYDERQKELITLLVNELVTEKQYVPFLKPFTEFIPWLRPYAELSYLEYRTAPGTVVTLHYVQEGQGEQYRQQKLDEICAGYFCHNFVLFFGQRLQYYFMENSGRERKLTESGFLEKSDMTGEESESRFGLLNDIVMCETLGDDRTKQELITRYKKESLRAELLFGE